MADLDVLFFFCNTVSCNKEITWKLPGLCIFFKNLAINVTDSQDGGDDSESAK
jgi:hypothetical protein